MHISNACALTPHDTTEFSIKCSKIEMIVSCEWQWFHRTYKIPLLIEAECSKCVKERQYFPTLFLAC